MSAHIDKKYIAMSKPYLDMAELTADGLNCRCPACGDSRKNKYKKRFHITIKDDKSVCHCFNCDYSDTFRGFLEKFIPNLYTDYIKEVFLDSKTSLSNSKSDFKFTSKTKKQLFKPTTESVTKKTSVLIPATQYTIALKYLTDRKVRPELLDQIFFTEDYRKLLEAVRYNTDENKVPEDSRIVFPLVKADKSFGGFIGRLVSDPKNKGNESLRYSKNTFDEKSIWVPKDIDTLKPIYVFEGIFDAAMFPNSIAVLSSSLELAREFFPTEELIFCGDNEPYNPQIMQKLWNLTKANESVFIADRYMKEKDFSDEISSGNRTIQEQLDYINMRVFKGPRAQLEFKMYNKSIGVK